MVEWLNLSGLTCVYLALLGAGVTYAVIILISGGLSHIDLPDIHIDIGDVDVGGAEIPDASLQVDVGGAPDMDHGEIGIRPLSPVSVASFITAFGAMGIIGTEVLKLRGQWSLLLAVGGALVIAALVNLAYGYFLIAPQGSSEVRIGDIIGAIGEVVTPIPAGKVGEVVFVARGTRVTSPARSADGSAIPRGTIVRITHIVGSDVLVKPAELEPEAK